MSDLAGYTCLENYVQAKMKEETEPIPPKEAAIAIEPPTDPTAAAAAANPPMPMVGNRLPSVGAITLSPSAIAGAITPVKTRIFGF